MNKLKLKNNEKIKFTFQIIAVALAGLAAGVGFKTFFEPFNIIPTGLSGLALIVHNLLSSVVNIPTSVIYTIFNIIIFAFAFKLFGWKFIVLSIIGVSLYILGMQFGYIEAIVNSSNEKILFAIVGAMIGGMCVGLALKMGGSTGGSDVLGAIINKKFPKIKTGYCILSINVVVLILSIITSGVQTGLYALVIAVISSLATNLVLDSSKRVDAFYIICDKDEEIAQAILDKYHRGVTKLDAMGMFSKKEKTLLLCLIPFSQSQGIKSLIHDIDKDAFVFSTSVTETVGDGNFMREASIFKNKIKNAKPHIKNQNKYSRLQKAKKIKALKKRFLLCEKYEKIENNSENESDEQ